MKTIVLADDEANLRTLLKATLDDPGYRILEASDGRSAVELTLNALPDLVILDWMLPGMTGIDVMKALRNDARTADLPIVMLTAKVQERDRLEALGLGATAFLTKPFSPLDLLDTVRSALSSPASESAAQGAGTSLPPREVRDQIAHSDSQLAFYACDLRRIVEAERRKSLELACANERLQSISTLKSEFLAFVSHELRTPLNAMSMVELLNPNGLSSEQDEAVEIMRTGYERLRAFTEKSLEYFNWLAIDHVSACSTIDLGALVQDACAGCPTLQRAGVDLEVLAPRDKHFVLGDATHLHSAVTALLDNAVKFSPTHQRVRVEVDSVHDQSVVTVSDAGIGLTAAALGELFKPYAIADVAHHSSGTGLNLAIAQAIARAHGGALRAHSAGRDLGATFILELPTSRPIDRAVATSGARGTLS